MKIAIVGVGEVGRCYAKALHAAGHEVLLCEAYPSAAAQALAVELNQSLQPEPGPWLAAVDWVMSCVTGTHALSVVMASVPHMRRDARFVDMTTASPSTKKQAAQSTTAAGLQYVDVAIMGAITLNWARTPLLASGHSAQAFADLMVPAGGRVQVIAGGRAGDAISLKILRSVFTKGMEALTVELLVSAERQGLREQLFEQLRDIDESPLRDFMEMLVRTHVVHAARRAHEVRDAQEVMQAQGQTSVVLPGVEQRFLNTAKHLKTRPMNDPYPTIETALQWLLSTQAA